MTSTILSALPQSPSSGFALGDFWSLTRQAGPLRWPIFFVLAVGLIQVFVKSWELMRDRRVSKALRKADVAKMSLKEIVMLVGRQEESMLSSLQSTMLNVFQTRPGEGLLHDEITNFVAFQQGQFDVFRRRMEFLSDTAGALGLMGTVWGMFTVFFQGSAEQDVILRGMGIALITTLLGLVVSIILNFSATELSTFHSKRLEQVSRKSDELRFRLMELAPEPAAAAAAPAPAPVAQPAPPTPSAPVPTEPPAPPSRAAAPETQWCYVELARQNGVHRAGEMLDDFALLVRDADGAAVKDVPVLVAVSGDGGSLGNGGQTLRARSDAEGRVAFACALPQRTGAFELDVSLPEQPGPATRLRIMVGPDVPHRVEQQGNHQAAVAGMRLPLPLGVRVLDRFGNAVADIPVAFRVRQGAGRLGSGNDREVASTDGQGRAAIPFVVSSEVGPNVVTATIDGMKDGVEFTAYGTEV